MLDFSGTSHETDYAFTLEPFASVVKAESKWNTRGRNVIFTLAKADKEAEYWPRLTKDKTKNNLITVDWNKWVDEDEEDEAPEVGGDFDPSMMNAFGGGGMPGMGGMGGMPGMGDMNMEELMKNMGGAQGMPDSDDEDEEEEAEGEPKMAVDALGDLDGEAEK